MMFKDEKLPASNYVVIRWLGLDQFAPEQSVTSHWISSKAFFAIRFILALYSTVIVWTKIGLQAGSLNHFFDKFTTLTFVGLHAYLVTSTVYHFRYLYTRSLDFYFNQYAILNYLYVYLYHSVITFNIVTPVVYWSFLNEKTIGSVAVWLNVSVHGVSGVMMLFNVILGRQKMMINLVLPVFINIVLYLLLSFVIYATQGYWVYPFLNWFQGGMVAVWYIAVGVITVISFFVQYLIHYLRDLIARKTQNNQEMDHFENVKEESKIEV